MKIINYLAGVVSCYTLLFLVACDSDTVEPNGGGDFFAEESIAQEISLEYTGGDLEFSFNNGATFSLKKSENLGLSSGEIKIKLIKNESYFNTNQDVVFDFSELKSDCIFNFEYLLKSNLVEEDIAVFQYLSEKSKDELKSKELKYSYDKTTGKIVATVAVSASNYKKGFAAVQSNDNYDRLVISWADRDKLSELDEEVTLQMPYYEQPGGTCWATCAAMLTRAYSKPKETYDSRKIIDFVKYLGHQSLDEGIGLWDFKRNLPKAIQLYSSVNTEVSTFVSSTSMLSEIIKKLKEKKPVIANLSYPGIGRHAIMIIGYKRELVSAAKINIKLLIHNPQNVGTESMYKWVDWSWLIKDKYFQEAWQILYPQSELSSPELITLGMPIDKELGDLHFRVTSPSALEKSGYTIGLKYSKTEQDGYYWNLNNNKCEVIPDTASFLEYKIPVYNAGKNSSQVKLKVKLINIKTGKTLLEDVKTANCTVGVSSISGSLDLNKLISDEVIDGEIIFELAENSSSKYLDGFIVQTKIKKSKIETLDHFSFSTAIVDKNFREINKSFSIRDISIKKSGSVYSGERTRYFINILEDSVRADEYIKIVFDNATNPTKFVEVKAEVVYRSMRHEEDLESYKVELENVPMVRIRPDIAEWRWWGIKGSELFQYIKKLEIDGIETPPCAPERLHELSIRFK